MIAKEIVVGTMGEIYVQSSGEADQTEVPTLTDDLKEIGTSFATAAKDAAENVISTFGVASMSSEESTEETEERTPFRGILKDQFTPLSAYAFITFVLLYMPCVVVAIAMKQEFGTWKWFGIAFAYQMLLAWAAAFVIYQGGKIIGNRRLIWEL